MNMQSVLYLLQSVKTGNYEIDRGQPLPKAPFDKIMVTVITSRNTVEFYIPTKLVDYEREVDTFNDEIPLTERFSTQIIDKNRDMFEKFFSWLEYKEQSEFSGASVITRFFQKDSIGDLLQDTYYIGLTFE